MEMRIDLYSLGNCGRGGELTIQYRESAKDLRECPGCMSNRVEMLVKGDSSLEFFASIGYVLSAENGYCGMEMKSPHATDRHPLNGQIHKSVVRSYHSAFVWIRPFASRRSAVRSSNILK